MHKRVKQFCENIRTLYPDWFTGKDVLDCGSLDINGNNRYLFQNCNYTGIDIVPGRNVDIVTPIHKYRPWKKFDVILSTEMLEHDEYYKRSLQNMVTLLKPKGLLLITAAGTGRPEHGTATAHPNDSPATHGYYQNITVGMIAASINLDDFEWFTISYDTTDIRFAGIKR